MAINIVSFLTFLAYSAAFILLPFLFLGSETLVSRHNIFLLIHILISILAFGILAVASLQAILWHYQNRELKQKSSSALLNIFPSLQTLENRLFRLLALGFLCFSLSLLGAFLLFSPHFFSNYQYTIILSLTAWSLLAFLLYRRYQTGFRGVKAIYWTLASLGVLMMAYLVHKAIAIM